ncbi:unnamed protein product [Moneuplotes crassus]|uniref:Uncharacterized protein n=1 Tax=Euplotes crassus TaxID=5936 RepID=A0AAD1Y8V8_EUPCR|nr:unnamed protein product [Moneuplotes crassus]
MTDTLTPGTADKKFNEDIKIFENELTKELDEWKNAGKEEKKFAPTFQLLRDLKTYIKDNDFILHTNNECVHQFILLFYKIDQQRSNFIFCQLQEYKCMLMQMKRNPKIWDSLSFESQEDFIKRISESTRKMDELVEKQKQARRTARGRAMRKRRGLIRQEGKLSGAMYNLHKDGVNNIVYEGLFRNEQKKRLNPILINSNKLFVSDGTEGKASSGACLPMTLDQKEFERYKKMREENPLWSSYKMTEEDMKTKAEYVRLMGESDRNGDTLDWYCSENESDSASTDQNRSVNTKMTEDSCDTGSIALSFKERMEQIKKGDEGNTTDENSVKTSDTLTKKAKRLPVNAEEDREKEALKKREIYKQNLQREAKAKMRGISMEELLKEEAAEKEKDKKDTQVAPTEKICKPIKKDISGSDCDMEEETKDTKNTQVKEEDIRKLNNAIQNDDEMETLIKGQEKKDKVQSAQKADKSSDIEMKDENTSDSKNEGKISSNKKKRKASPEKGGKSSPKKELKSSPKKSGKSSPKKSGKLSPKKKSKISKKKESKSSPKKKISKPENEDKNPQSKSNPEEKSENSSSDNPSGTSSKNTSPRKSKSKSKSKPKSPKKKKLIKKKIITKRSPKKSKLKSKSKSKSKPKSTKSVLKERKATPGKPAVIKKKEKTAEKLSKKSKKKVKKRVKKGLKKLEMADLGCSKKGKKVKVRKTSLVDTESAKKSSQTTLEKGNSEQDGSEAADIARKKRRDERRRKLQKRLQRDQEAKRKKEEREAISKNMGVKVPDAEPSETSEAPSKKKKMSKLDLIKAKMM